MANATWRLLFWQSAVCALSVSTAWCNQLELPQAARGVLQLVAHRGASKERPECTLAAIRRAFEVGATAVEVDVRRSRDGVLFLLHDATLDRTTNGSGPAAGLTIKELRQLDAGSWFSNEFAGERIPTLREALGLSKRYGDLLLDLKEQGEAYDRHVAGEVKQFGDPARIIVGVRSTAQARRFRELLPESRQLGLIPSERDIATFAAAGVETIRLWPRWLTSDNADLVAQVRQSKCNLHLNGTDGSSRELRSLLPHGPWSLSADDPAEMLTNLARIAARPSLPNTAPVVWLEEDLSRRLMDGAHRFAEQQIEVASRRRRERGRQDRDSEWREGRRAALQRMIGANDKRLPARMFRVGDELTPALVAETPRYRVFQVRWPVLDGVWGEGLLVRPTKTPRASVVAIPDCDTSPEQLLGLAPGIPPDRQFARVLADNGFELVIPALLNRDRLGAEDARLRRSDQTRREWIYRQAFQMGRHIIGYEVQTVRSALDWFERVDVDRSIGVAGFGEGGLIAFYTSAIDPRVDASLTSGYFGPRDSVWSEPIYRNVFGLLREFGDAELAQLMGSRPLIVEYSQVPPITGHKGSLQTPPWRAVKREVERARQLGAMVQLVSDSGRTIGPGSKSALTRFAKALSASPALTITKEVPAELRPRFSTGARQQRILAGMERHVQQLVRQSEHVRDAAFLFHVAPQLANQRWSTQKSHPVQHADGFEAAARPLRRRFHRDLIGQFDADFLPLNPRTRRILSTPAWDAYDVVLDVHDELFAWGVLLIPTGIKPGEQRPVVVCQHGRNGVPRDTIDRDVPAYNNFAAQLAERGFICFSPHNLYRGEDRYRWLDRKANATKTTLFSFIVDQHRQILRWLGALPQVDADRIAFYGLSYGGETAVRVPSILEGYCLSICSGDFNQWTRKVAATDQPFTFMRTIEWEMPYWNLGNTFDYAEMAYLIFPRPFMVERGHLDRVGRDRWVAHEYAKVRWLYAQYGIPERTRIEFFQGGHSINGVGTFEFLHQHLKWPAPQPEESSEQPGP